MDGINKELQEYIETWIFPQYLKNDEGHNLKHIQYVIERSLRFATQFPDINMDMVFAAAAYHDIAHHIDKDRHEVLSAEVFWADENTSHFFSDKQRIIIKEAIEDHRASSESEPRNDYGKIISSADRSTDIVSIIQRSYAYSMKHFPEYGEQQTMERCYGHIKNKYGKGGYAKHYCMDEEYEKFRKDVELLSNDRQQFEKIYKNICLSIRAF